MFAKLNNGQLQNYPYTLGMLRKDNSNISFPKNISDEDLAKFNVVRVTPTAKPVYDYTKDFSVTAEKVNDVWVEKWIATNVTAEEIASRTENKANEVRAERDYKLSKTDWRFRSDMNPNQAWIDYCQALRDVPAQAGFPWDVQWPSQPE
jgi:hypothetical protein